MWRRALAALALFSGCAPAPTSDSGTAGHAAHRLVAIGDLHGDISAARQAFRLAGGIDRHGNWIGDDLVIVQLGDLIGRSYEDREVLDFVLEVREKARVAGGAVHVVLGNHEVFAAQLRYDYVDVGAYQSFDGIPDLDLDNDLLRELPVEARARGSALMPGGPYAKRLADFPAVLRLGETVFVHGGVTPIWAEYGPDRINDEVSRWFAGETDQPLSARGVDAGNLDDNVMMSRHFSEDVDEASCELLSESLALLGARRMVVAHSVQPEITSYCGGRVWAVDVGMSRYYGGEVQVLEIIDDEVASVLDLETAERLELDVIGQNL